MGGGKGVCRACTVTVSNALSRLANSKTLYTALTVIRLPHIYMQE